MLFKVALETIIGKLKEYEADCESRGIVLKEKYGHLDKIVDDEQNRIVDLNEQIGVVEKSLAEC